MLKFRAAIASPVTAALPPLAAATFAHLGALDAAIATAASSALTSTSATASDEVRERRALLRSYLSLLHSLVHSELTSVLTAPSVHPHLSPSLRVLLASCVEGPDLQLQRQCFVILQRLVDEWVGTVSGFETYVLHEVLPVCFQAPAQPHFSLKDAASLPLLEASAALQVELRLTPHLPMADTTLTYG